MDPSISTPSTDEPVAMATTSKSKGMGILKLTGLVVVVILVVVAFVLWNWYERDAVSKRRQSRGTKER